MFWKLHLKVIAIYSLTMIFNLWNSKKKGSQKNKEEIAFKTNEKTSQEYMKVFGSMFLILLPKVVSLHFQFIILL